MMTQAARAVSVAALLLWVAALVLLILVMQNVTYTVCDGPLLQLPPPSVHWPPEGHDLALLDMQHQITLVAVGASIVAAFLTLYASPQMGVMRRSVWLVAALLGSLLVGGFLWLAVQYHVVHAQVNAMAGCL